MSDSQQVRDQVSRAYTAAVEQPPSSCCGESTTKGTAAKLAGYGDEQLHVLPTQSVENSFGCGNPLAFSEVQPGQVVVDLGCGAGIDLLLAAQKVGPEGRAIGIDMTDAMIERARQAIAEAGATNAEVRKGIIEELPLDDASVDWIISNCVINLSPEKPRVFAEIARVLKPGGQILISDMVAEEIPDELRDIPALYSSCLTGAIKESEYLAGLEAAGLTDVTVRHRFTFTAAQLAALVDSELAQSDPMLQAAIASSDDATSKRILEQLDGQIASLQIYARKAG